MCLYPKLIPNKRYLPTKKNGGVPPVCPDERLRYVTAACGDCYECRKQKQRQWIERIVMQNIMVGGSASDKTTIAALENLLNPNYKKAKLTSLHGRRVGYEASRLLRTETNVSAREAQRLASLRNPASKGFVWRASGECCDICESLNGEQFKADEIPHNPHPNCKCSLIEVVEDIDSFTDRYLEFMDNPKSQPDIDNWYRNVYKKAI